MKTGSFLQPAGPHSADASVHRARRGDLATRLFDGLAAHPRAAFAATVGYLSYIILSHDLMQQPAYWAQGRLSHRQWNHLVTCVALPILGAFSGWLLIKIARHSRPVLAASFLVLTVGLMALTFRTLLVMNIETIHFPQYAILAGLILTITRSFTSTMIWATLAALLDEGYQYFYLYSHRGIHMDFNDMVLNGIGAGFGLVLVFGAVWPKSRFFGPQNSRPGLLRSKAVWLAGGLLAVCVALVWSGRLCLLSPDDGSWAIVLRRGGPSTSFWTPTTWGKTYHEIQPLEWLVLGTGIVILYGLLDRVGSKPNQSTMGLNRLPLP